MTIFTFNSGFIKHYQLMLTAVVIVLTVLSCEGKLDDTGIDGLDPDIIKGTLRKDTVDVRSVTHFGSFMDSVSTGNAQRLYLGKSGGYQFRMIFYFAIPTGLDSVNVKPGVRFRLMSAGSFGGSGVFSASIHPVLREWTENDIRWDRFEPGRDYGPAFGQFQVSGSDTQKSVTTITIPRDTVQHWVWAKTDTTRKNFGLLIDFPGDANFIQQYYGGGVTVSSGGVTPDAGVVPMMIFHWQKTNSTGDIIQDSATITPVTLISGLSRFSGGRQGYLYRESVPGPGNQLWVGSGIPYHSFIRFASDSIPKGSTISQAIMTMRIDTTEAGWVTGASRTLQTVRVTTNPADWKSGGIGLNETDSYLIGFESTDQYRWLTGKVKGDTVSFNVTQQLQSWVTNSSSNNGLQIFHTNELTGNFNDIYRMKIRLDSTDPERSPKIVVYYTLPPVN